MTIPTSTTRCLRILSSVSRQAPQTKPLAAPALQRIIATSSSGSRASHNAQHSPRARSRAASLAAAAAAAAAVAATHSVASAAPARAEDGESRPPWETGRSQPLRWTALVETLGSAQAALLSADGFTARRRRCGEAGEEAGELWEFQLEFPADESCDMFDLFSSLMHAFSGGETTVRAEELATRTILRASQPRGFELAITVPRRPGRGVDRTVMLEVLRSEADAFFSANEVAAVVRAYRKAQGGDTVRTEERGGGRKPAAPHASPPRSPVSPRDAVLFTGRDLDDVLDERSDEERKIDGAIAKLEELGAEVFVPDETLSWAALAGYEEEKRVIVDSVVLPLTHPELYEGIVRETRKRYETVLPRAVLMTGLPGCGKSTAARILASAIGLPFVNLKVEAILSKYFGETTKKLSEILETTRDLGPCVIFCDEIDSLGSSRDDPESHEVTRRTLSVLLRFLDGLDGPQQSVLVAATNMPKMLDAALISRFDVVIPLGLPNLPTRTAILGLYAQQLTETERESLAAIAQGFSGRELRDACKAAERACAGRAVRAAVEAKVQPIVTLPLYSDYCDAFHLKAQTSIGAKWRPEEASEPLPQEA